MVNVALTMITTMMKRNDEFEKNNIDDDSHNDTDVDLSKNKNGDDSDNEKNNLKKNNNDDDSERMRATTQFCYCPTSPSCHPDSSSLPAMQSVNCTLHFIFMLRNKINCTHSYVHKFVTQRNHQHIQNKKNML